jgi:hypothetical protein
MVVAAMTGRVGRSRSPARNADESQLTDDCPWERGDETPDREKLSFMANLLD